MPINTRMMAPGLSRLAAALAGDGRQQGFENQMTLESRMAQALANARASDAHAGLFDAQAEAARQKTDAASRRPALVDEQAAIGAGTTIPIVRAFRDQLQGHQGPPQFDIDPAIQTKIGQQLQRLLPLLAGTDDIKVDDWAQAQGRYGDRDLRDSVVAGRVDPAAVGRAHAAMGGKPLFNSDANGAVLDIFGGALDTANPMAQSSIGLKRDQGAQARAGAAKNYAQAGKANAEAENIRAGRAGAKPPVGYRWSADGAALEPIKGGPADPTTKSAKLNKPPTDSQDKSLQFSTRMQIADDILSELAAEGYDQRGRIRQAVGTIPVIGTAAGMLANAVTSEQQQRVEQAQRAFINAALRRESGAVISPEEFKNAEQQYFPQPFDDDKTKRQKAENRRAAIEAMKVGFGEQFLPGFDRIVGEAKAARAKAAKAAKKEGGASGEWKIERVGG